MDKFKKLARELKQAAIAVESARNDDELETTIIAMNDAETALLDAIREATRPTYIYQVVFAGDGEGDLLDLSYLDKAAADARRDELAVTDWDSEYGEWKTGKPTVTMAKISYPEDVAR
jgi:hypothetical protein